MVRPGVRPLRIEFPRALYHLTARGNARQDIFLDDADRHLFLSVLDRAVLRFRLMVHAYCLKDNHYHLLLETPEANLSRALRQSSLGRCPTGRSAACLVSWAPPSGQAM